VLRYWSMPTSAPVNNDLLVLLSSGRNPVLAHLFLDYLLDFKNSMTNFSWLGYQPPQQKIDAELLVKRQLIPTTCGRPWSRKTSGGPARASWS
jgi:spermidine/putrescine transport system substrate-binding protein